ncbi:MAG: hypothetical protein RIG62_16835 [Cyclobacteriaceae bacterium]
MSKKLKPQRLESIVKTNRYVYQLIDRTSNYAIFAQMNELGGVPIGYEVIRITMTGGKTFKGKYYPPKERYPCASQFGRYGWSYRDLKDALAKYEAFREQENQVKQLISILLPEETV